MKDFVTMDWTEYRKTWVVYITDMKSLEVENPEIWNHFMEKKLQYTK